MHDCGKLLDAIERYIAKADEDLEDALTGEGFLEAKKTVEQATEIEDAVTEILEAETDMYVSAASDAVDLKEFADLLPDIELDDTTAAELAKAFKSHFETMMPELISAYIAQTDRGLTLISVTKRTVAWIEEWSEELGRLMKLTSHNQLESILKRNLEEGKGIDKFVRDIQESGIRNERYRARRVAVTEALRAHSVAAEEAIQQSPAVEEKEWMHTGSYRNDPRENHIAMSGQIVPKNQPFELAGADGNTYYPQYPRDISLPASESINCHCIHRGIASEKILGLSLEERRRLQAEALAEMDDAWEAELDAKNKAKAGIE